MAKDVLITPIDGIIQFSASDGDGTGQIKVDGDDLVISNLVGDVLLGDGASDVFIGNGSDNVDIVFEQNGEIRDDGSGKTITIGSATTTLILSSSSDITLQGGGGNVGIGTTTAGEQLEVIGNISASGFVSASAFGGDGSALTNVSSTPTTGTISSSAQIVESLPFGTSGIFSASAAGSSQGKFKLNGVDVDVNGLGTNGDVTFDTLILDAGGLKGVGAFSSSAQFASEDILLGNITASNISASGNLFIKGDGTFGMGSSNPSVRVQNIDDSIGWNFATKATIHSYFNPQTPATTHFGIKTTTPSVALEVAGDISASGALYATNISASSTLKIDSDDDILLQAKSEIYFRSGSTNYARFDAPSGALGIGTSTPGNNNALLTVAGNISASGDISASGKIIGDDFEFNLPTVNERKFRGLTNVGVRLHDAAGGWAMSYGFQANGEEDLGGFGAFGGGSLEYFFVGNHYQRSVMTIHSGSTNGVVIGDGIAGTVPPKTLTVRGDISASGDLYLAGAIAASGILSSSAQVVESLPFGTSGIISSSTQIVESLPFGTSGIFSSSAQLPSGIFSGSAAGTSQGQFQLNGVDIDVNGLGTNGDVTFDTLVLDAGGLKGVGAFSSSVQLPSGIFSASAAGTSQGQFQLNEVDIDVNGLGTNGDVTFDTLVLDAGGLKGVGAFSSSAQLPSGIFSASAAGGAQGQFKLNGVDIDVNGLGTNGDPTFDTLVLDAGGLKGVGAFSSSAQFAGEDILLGNITASNISASGNLFIKQGAVIGMGSSAPSLRVQNVDDSIGWNLATKATIHSYFNPQTPATTHFGIKTTTPSVALEVKGDISASGALWATNISASSTLKIDSDNDILVQAKSEIFFRSGSTNYARFDAPSGTLGIGTSTPGNNDALLTVAGNISASGNIVGNEITASGVVTAKQYQNYIMNFDLDPSTLEYYLDWQNDIPQRFIMTEATSFLVPCNTNVRHILMRGTGFDQNLSSTQTIVWKVKTHSPLHGGGNTYASVGNWTTQEQTTVSIGSGTDTTANKLIYAKFSGSHAQGGDFLAISFDFGADYANGADEFFVTVVLEHDYNTLPFLAASDGTMVTGSDAFGTNP